MPDFSRDTYVPQAFALATASRNRQTEKNDRNLMLVQPTMPNTNQIRVVEGSGTALSEFALVPVIVAVTDPVLFLN